MVKGARTRATALYCLPVLLTSCLGLAGEAKVVMFRSNSRHTAVYDSPAIRLGRLKWRFKTNGKIRSSPAVLDGSVCFGSEDGYLYSVNADNGRLLWKFKTAGDVSSSPAIEDDTVYFLSADGAFYALDLKTGQQRWKYQAGPDLPFEAMKGDPRTWDYFLSSPTLVNESVFIGSGDGNLYALNRKSGKLIWKFRTEGRVRTSPAVDAGVVYVGSFDNQFYAVDVQTGNLRWKIRVGGPIQSSPAVSDGLVYFGSRDCFLHAVAAETGREVWKADHQGSWVVTSPAVAHGMVFAGSSDGEFVQGLDARTGVEKWRFKTGGNVFSSPAVAGEAVYFGAFNVQLYSLDIQHGKLQSLNVAESAINSSPVLAGETLYVGSDDNCLYAFAGEPLRVRQDLALSPSILDAYCGEYEISPAMVVTVTREGSHLMAQATGQAKIQLAADSDTDFYFSEAGLEIKFLKDDKGQVSSVKVDQGGQSNTFKKIK